jgi:hypothetical protein
MDQLIQRFKIDGTNRASGVHAIIILDASDPASAPQVTVRTPLLG